MLSLGFFNPLFLWALPLAAVPIIIHLLNRRRFNKVPWAAMEYLLRAMKRNRRRLQMEHWIVLLLRTLAVVFLVFLVTRPQLTGASGVLKARTHHLVCIDDSASMAQRMGAVNLQKAAADRVNQLVGKLVDTASGDLFTLMRSSQVQKQPVLFAQRVATPLRKKVRDELSASTPGDAALDAGTFLAAAKKWALEKQKEASDVHYYLVTDSREHDFHPGGKPAAGVLKHLSEMDPLHEQLSVLLVGGSENDNVGVTAVRRRDRLAMAGASVTLEVEVTNFGEETTSAAEVGVETGNSRIVRPVPPISAGERVIVDVEHTFHEPGFHGVVASLPKDHYTVDDQGYLALEVVATSPVLVVNGDPGTGSDESETYFLSAALDTGGDVLSGITVTEILPHSLADFDLAHVNMVWLANVAVPGSAEIEKLEAFVAAGGGLVTFLGDQTDVTSFNKLLHKDGEGLMPLPITELRLNVDRPDRVVVTDKQHYSLSSLSRSPDLLEMLFSSTVLVGRYYGLREDPGAPVSVPLRIRNVTGHPFMASKTFRQGGESVLFTTTADEEWSSFCGSPTFLVLCQEIHKHATKSHSLAAYNLDSTGTLQLEFDPAHYRRDVLVRALGGQGFEGTYTAQDREAGADTGRIASIMSLPMSEVQGLGLFQIAMSPHRGDTEHRLLARVAPSAEGRLRRLNRAQWLRAYPNMDDRLDVIEGSASDAALAGTGEGEVWRLLALALLSFLLLETVLAWRFGRR